MQLRRSLCQVILAAGSVAGGLAQVDTATITGKVTDTTGAAMPNVQISVVQTETNFHFSSVTNNDGIYRIQSLQPGPYMVTFEASGFKRMVRQNIALHVGDVLAVDATLEVGAVTESVEVKSSPTLLQTETSSTGTVTEGDQLYKLAMYQRYITNVMTIVPGLTNTTTGGTNGLGSFYVAGTRNTGTGVFEDGVFANDPLGSTTTIKPIENSVDEVKVLTGTLPAEYGHSAGGIITTVKKSGTNEFHGSASDFGRTRIMTHRQYFNLYTTAQAQPGAPNGVPAWFMQPDASGGGPLVIPKIYNGRNRTFWFIGYNKLIEKKTQAYTSVTPTPDELQGDFTFGGLGQTLYDPLTTRQNADGTWSRDPFPTKVIPLSRFDPVSAKILSYNVWRPPNTPGSFSSTGPVSNFTYNPPSRTFFEDYSGRVDHQINANFKLYSSYTYNHENGLGRPTSIQIPAFDGTTGYNTPATQQNTSAGATYVFNPTTVNEFRVSFFRLRNDMFVPSYNQDWGAKLGIPNLSPALMPSFSATALGVGTYTVAPDYPQLYGLTVTGGNRNIRQSMSLRDDVSKVHGSHAFKTGYEILYFTANYFQVGQPSGVFQFDNMTAGLQPNGQPVPNTGNNFAAFELGSVKQVNFTTYTNTWQPRDSINSLYFQDDWKVSQNLTLNLGLRWSTESPYHTAHGQESQFSPTAVDPLTGLMGAVIHPTGGLNSRDLKNFQPRFGFAYHPLNKWVFRGGFGLNTIDIRWPNSLMQFDEYQAQVLQARAVNDPRPLFQLSQGPAPVAYNVLPDGSSPYFTSTGNYSSRNIRWLDPALHPGYVLNWNFTVEYQISANSLLKVFYQGSTGVDLIENWNVNAFPTDFGANNPALQSAAFANTQAYLPYPQFGTITQLSNTGHSSFHSGTVQYSKRYSHGLVLDSFYTYSKALDDCDTDGTTCTGVAPMTDRNLNKGRASFDMRHRFVTSATYELPVGKGRRFLNRGGPLNFIFGGYDISWIQTVDTGNPFSFSFANSPYNYYPTSIGARNPDLVATPVMSQFGLGNQIGPNRFNQNGEYALVSSSGGQPASYANCALPTCNISAFAPPAAFTPGNAGRNILTGPAAYFSQVSAKKNFRITERVNLQLRYDFQNPFHNFAFSPPSATVDFKNPQLFGKITSDVATANIQGEPLMNLMLRLTW